MKAITILISIAFVQSIQFTAMAETPTENDSIASSTLNELVVEGESRFVTAETETYIPNKTIKENAMDALSMLRLMNIPHITISPLSSEVTTSSGTPVGLFINGHPASPEELSNLRTKNALKVEYLDHPMDARYMGNEYAINFVMREYEYGGYSRISENLLFNPDHLKDIESSSSLYSKFSYKKMTYDFALNHNYAHSISNKTRKAESFLLNTHDGRPYTASRTIDCYDSKYFRNTIPVSFRAVYANNNLFFSNTFGFTYESSPLKKESGSLSIIPDMGSGYISETIQSAKSYALTWNSMLQYAFKNGWIISVMPTISYSHSNQGYNYSTDLPDDFAIVNNASDDSFMIDYNVSASKTFNRIHNLSATVRGSYSNSDTHYTGNTIFNSNFYEDFESVYLRYSVNPGRWNCQISAGGAHQAKNSDGVALHYFYPFFSTRIAYAPTNKHRIALFWNLASKSPQGSMTTDHVFQANEFMFYSGNPSIKDYTCTNANISWTWLPINELYIGLGGNYSADFNRLVSKFSEYNDGKGVLLSYTNNGNFHFGKIYAQFNINLLKGALSFNVSPSLSMTRSSGFYDRSLSYFQISANAFYSLKNFNFMVYYSSPNKYLNSQDCSINKTPHFMELQIGWAKAGWNIQIAARNPWRSSYLSNTSDLRSQVYQSLTETYSLSYHRQLRLTVAYTFEYGKQINHNNELKANQALDINNILR